MQLDNVNKCKRCEWTWVQRGDDKPKRCPRCRSIHWQAAKEVKQCTQQTP